MTTYGSGQVARTPRIITDVGPDTIVKDRMVVGLDDISDSGSTFNLFRNHMLNKGAGEVEQAVLIDREIPKNMTPHIAALKTKTLKWLTGKGLDDEGVKHEANRQLPYVAIALTQAKEF
jgi:hypoxanthine-guanine phosphoribosyltransferase